jgi:hypothetical protein
MFIEARRPLNGRIPEILGGAMKGFAAEELNQSQALVVVDMDGNDARSGRPQERPIVPADQSYCKDTQSPTRVDLAKATSVLFRSLLSENELAGSHITLRHGGAWQRRRSTHRASASMQGRSKGDHFQVADLSDRVLRCLRRATALQREAFCAVRRLLLN